jgi:hypothetical protein
MVKAQTNPQLIETARRRALVFRLRKAGATYIEVANAVIYQYGQERLAEVGPSWPEHYGTTDLEQARRMAGLEVLPSGWDELYAYKDVKRELDKLRDEIKESAEDIRSMQDARLDAMLRAIWPRIVRDNPDLKAMDRGLRIMDRRAKLWGLDAPSKFAPTDPSGQEPYQGNVISVYQHLPDDEGEIEG